MQVTTVGSKGRVVIPWFVRQKLGIKTGDWIGWDMVDRTVYLRKVVMGGGEGPKILVGNSRAPS